MPMVFTSMRAACRGSCMDWWIGRVRGGGLPSRGTRGGRGADSMVLSKLLRACPNPAPRPAVAAGSSLLMVRLSEYRRATSCSSCRVRL